jgi:hypothetical protein
MWSDRVIKILLLTIVMLLVLNFLYSWRAGSSVFIGAQLAQAQQVPAQYFVLDKDSFIITANTEGDAVYVYYFNRKPMKEESTIEFVTKATAKR